ncbi:uncharacterized protein [Henckelia pumila]|uniref:uncharacterized protein n=1 Tax=Henckelia pumila TaxID=405737 RepID=UPI003C6E6209
MKEVVLIPNYSNHSIDYGQTHKSSTDHGDHRHQGGMGRMESDVRGKSIVTVEDCVDHLAGNDEDMLVLVDPKRRRVEDDNVEPNFSQGPEFSQAQLTLIDPKNFVQPNFVFLMALKIDKSKVERVKRKLGFEGLLVVPCSNNGGGIALFWKEKSMVRLLAYFRNFIAVVVTIQVMEEWRLTCYYGFPERSCHRLSWDLLRTLSQRSSLPCCCMGDFNDILSHFEKQGNIRHPISLINGFREAVEDCVLIDLGMRGHMFTWEKSRGSIQFMEKRLDRALANSYWSRVVGTAEVSNLEVVNSDHSAIFLNIFSPMVYRRRQFRFENSWLFEPECRSMVSSGWRRSIEMDIQSRIEFCGNVIQIWGDKVRLKFNSMINQCRDELKHLKRIRSAQADQQLLETRQKLDFLLAQEEVFWKQRAKLFWLKSRDDNTKLFHHYDSSRKRKNIIGSLIDYTGKWCSWDDGMNELILSYFQNLFMSNGDKIHNLASLCSKRLDQDHIHLLLQPFDEDEVKEALFSMHPDKSPGPDGMNLGFYQSF